MQVKVPSAGLNLVQLAAVGFCSFKKWLCVTKLDQEASEILTVVLWVDLETLQDVVLCATGLLSGADPVPGAAQPNG